MGDGRLAYATGCSGQMFKFGAAMGERLAETVTGRIDGSGLMTWARGDGLLAGVGLGQ
jgi:glycine/D-amino acid oxidase-like deaminating enzyme